MEERNAAKTLAAIQKQLTLQEELINKLKSDVSALKIDAQFYVKSPKDIVPGSKCKITYDTTGLVNSGSDLIKTDIPQLDISQINGLSEALNSKASKSDTERLDQRFEELLGENDTTFTMASKVIFNKSGLIRSYAELSADDIPTIPVTKVTGVLEMINQFANRGERKQFKHTDVMPNTATKVTYDAFGHVIQSEKLGINDLPRELINQVNEIESTLTDMAPKRVVESLLKQVNDLTSKVETYPNVSTTSEVQTDTIEIDDVNGLKEKIRNFVTYDQINDIRTEVSTLSGLVAGKKATPVETSSTGTYSQKLGEISRDIADLNGRISYIYENVPIDRIMSEFSRLTSELRSINDRLTELERKMR